MAHLLGVLWKDLIEGEALRIDPLLNADFPFAPAGDHAARAGQTLLLVEGPAVDEERI